MMLQTKRALGTVLLLLGKVALLATCAPATAYAFSRNSVWNNVYDPAFPILRVYGCPGRFATYFPTFPWDNILSQAQQAMNEWFIGGGADVRMRYEGDLGDADPRCVNETPDTGTVLLSAEQANGSGNCNWATTFYPSDTNGNSTSALVIFHAGTVCNGAFQAFPWATNADYPQANPAQVDFQSVFLHELGHALGFNHSSDPNAVMFAFGNEGDVTRRFLADDDVRGLFGTFPYSPTQMNMYDVWTNNDGATWNSNSIGPPTFYAVGGVAACVNNDGNSNVYQGVWTDIYPYQTINTFTYVNSFSFGATIGSGAETASAIACGSDRTWYGWVDGMTRNVQFVWNVGGTWIGSNAPGVQSGVPPAAAEVHDATGAVAGYLLAFTNPGTGHLSTLFSTDRLTFPISTLATFDFRTFLGFGIACKPQIPQCVVTFADGGVAQTPMMSATLSVDATATSPVTLLAEPRPLCGSPNSYGGTVQFANSNAKGMIAWRDRGFNTVLASTVDGATNWSSVTMHSVPSLAWANSYGTYAAFFCYASRYGAF
jgi:hypothetical protein